MSFIVDVSEPKPNRSNTMNLVEKRTQKLGLYEDLVNGRAGSLGDRIVNGVVEERVKVRPWASSEVSDSRILRGYCGAKGSGCPNPFRIISPRAQPRRKMSEDD